MKRQPNSKPLSTSPAQLFDLAQVCMQVCAGLEELAKAKGVGLVVEIAPKAMQIFQGDPARLSVALSCLVRKAIARARGGYVRIHLKVAHKSNALIVRICDNGGAFDRKPCLDMLLARCVAHVLGGRLRRRYYAGKGGSACLSLPFRAAKGLKRTTFIQSLRAAAAA
jgi:hypothetical protein